MRSSRCIVIAAHTAATRCWLGRGLHAGRCIKHWNSKKGGVGAVEGRVVKRTGRVIRGWKRSSRKRKRRRRRRNNSGCRRRIGGAIGEGGGGRGGAVEVRRGGRAVERGRGGTVGREEEEQ
ncbi:hypothetical protein PoB_000983500 [Plakobranchus ocellatus]|uniref:Uncharacterized protein n=1 Tax=Plakobranchus ocellatus TaxID=259542 RepID=A0AAV3YJR9_9GAST|nr:hypothetical protein PoB_000983500 [Plakobranchus ocellatus]